MKFKPQEIQILKNYGSMFPSMIIYPNELKIKNVTSSVLSYYEFEEKYDFEPFGIYDIPKFLSILSMFKDPEITVKDKFLKISENDYELKYLTTASGIIEEVPNIEKKFNLEKIVAEFDLGNDKLNFMLKAASALKCQYMFFDKIDNNKIKISVSDNLDNSAENFSVIIDSGITINEINKPIKVMVSVMNFIPGDYTIKLSENITNWKNLSGNLQYYVGVSKD